MKKYRVGIIVLSIGFLLFAIAVVQNYIEKKEIKRNKYITVGKVYKYNNTRRGADIIYYYYNYNGKVYKSDELSKDFLISDKYLTYFEVEISTENPSYSRIHLDKKITDTLKIKAAGFSLDDDKKDKKYN